MLERMAALCTAAASSKEAQEQQKQLKHLQHEKERLQQALLFEQQQQQQRNISEEDVHLRAQVASLQDKVETLVLELVHKKLRQVQHPIITHSNCRH